MTTPAPDLDESPATLRRPFEPLHAGFVRNSRLLPEGEALHLGGRAITYANADESVRRWAGGLLDACGRRPARVALFAYRSEPAYLGVLASLLAGAAFVPLNPRFPAARTRAMLEQADVDAVIVDAGSLALLPEILRNMPRRPAVLAPELDAHTVRGLLGDCAGPILGAAELDLASPVSLLPTVDADDVAYLLFTSGSTGAPKGVPVTHANARAFLDTNLERYRLKPSDRLTQTFDQTFDLSVFDLFMAWESGACVCPMQPLELLTPFRFIERNQITVWFSVPSVAALLLHRGVLTPGRMPTLRWSLFCGEKLPRQIAEAWQAAAPHSTVENLYGPTELTIACAAYRWDPATSPAECMHDVVPIGEIYSGLEHRVVDDQLHDVPVGAVGELCVAGPQTWPGYWRNPQQTAERCFERTAADDTVHRFYRTGDLVRRRVGCYVFIGRNDEQVKIGGYRIELGEVEAAIVRAGAAEVVVLPWPDANTPDHLVAVAVEGTGAPAELGARLKERLPGYMLPRAIEIVRDLPRNANGKVDRPAVRAWLTDQRCAA